MIRTVQHLASRLESDAPRLRTAADRVSYYDFVLAVIPMVFLVAALLGRTTSLSAVTVLRGASVVAALAVVDALFLNPPMDEG